MKTTLLLVGKTTGKLYAEAIEDYAGRISHYIPFNIKVIPDLKNNKNLTENQQKEKEGELILKAIEDKSFVMLLDEHGKEYRSVEFASWLENKQQTARSLTFVVGGPYGFHSRCMTGRTGKCHFRA